MNIAAQIVKACTEQPMTILEIADAIGRAESTIRNYITGIVNSGDVIKTVGGYGEASTYRASPKMIERFAAVTAWTKRYHAAFGQVRVALDLDNDPKRKRICWLGKYLFCALHEPANESLLYKREMQRAKGSHDPDTIFPPPIELWRLESRTLAFEKLARLPVTLLVDLGFGGVPIDKPQHKLTPLERGDEIPTIVAAAWGEMGAAI